MSNPYHLAARFPSEETAGLVYLPLQEMIFEAKDDCDLSAYRLAISGVWHVVVLGEEPPQDLHLKIEAQLTRGVLVTLRADALRYLFQRRTEATLLGPWVEGHYHHSDKEK